MDLSHTIAPKSDQMNADDLISGNRIITITDVTANDSDQPVSIRFDGDDGKPYKPCKSMRRVMISIWGKNASDWIGQSIELYRDPNVKYAGQAVGGIRIAKATGIKETKKLMLTVTRSKRAPYNIEPLVMQAQVYPDDKFNRQFAKMETAIKTGKMTHADVIARLEKTAAITEAQRGKIMAVQIPEPETNPSNDDFNDEETY